MTLGGQKTDYEEVEVNRTFGGVLILCLVMSGCSGLSRQYRATTEGMAVNYIIQNESMVRPKESINIVLVDERIDKDLIGDGAKSSVGNRFLGYLAFGVFYAAVPDQPTFLGKEDPVKVFKTAMAERLSKNGVGISNDKDENQLMLELLVRRFKLDFNFGKWIAEAGYVAKLKGRSGVLCEKEVFEKISKFNMYGYGSGEEAINEVFNKAINNFDANSCFAPVK
jgi:hypothetical protein